MPTTKSRDRRTIRAGASTDSGSRVPIAGLRFGTAGAESRPSRLRRWVRRSLLAPFLGGRHPPEYGARGVFVGLLVGLTPTVGIQIPILALLWAAARRIAPRRQFSLIVATAWTFVSNPLTTVPLYYAFVVTGRLILGRWDRLRGYDVFEERLLAALPENAGWIEATWSQLDSMLDRFGLPLIVGCVPWSLLVSVLGYRWSLRLIVRHRAKRARRRQRRGGVDAGKREGA